jgi:hypothetical protein
LPEPANGIIHESQSASSGSQSLGDVAYNTQGDESFNFPLSQLDFSQVAFDEHPQLSQPLESNLLNPDSIPSTSKSLFTQAPDDTQEGDLTCGAVDAGRRRVRLQHSQVAESEMSDLPAGQPQLPTFLDTSEFSKEESALATMDTQSSSVV